MKFFKKYKLEFIVSFSTIAILSLILTFVFRGIFGEYSIYGVDLKHQYQNFYYYYKHNITNPMAFIINQNFGLGQETFGMFNYYLSSPLNLILLIFPDSQFELSIIVLIYTKFILGSLAMVTFLKRYQLKSYLTVLLTLVYVFSGYFVSMFTTPIWLDIIYLLPLSMLGLEYLVEKNSKKLFIIATSLMIISNFYIGYMLCLFSVIYLSYRLFITHLDKKSLDLKVILKNYIVSAIFIGLTSLLTLYTSYLSISSSKGIDASQMPSWTSFNFNFFDFTREFLFYSKLNSNIYNNNPNIWVTSFTFILIFIMLFSGVVSKKLKLLNVLYLGGIYFILCNENLDLILHGLSKPIGFLFRDSFFFVFMIIVIVSDFSKRTNSLTLLKIKPINYVSISILLVLNVIGIQLFAYNKLTNLNIILVSLFTVICLIGVAFKKHKLLGISIVLEICLSTFFILLSFFSYDYHIDKVVIRDYSNETGFTVQNNVYRLSKNYNFTEMEDIIKETATLRGYSSTLKKESLNYLSTIGINSDTATYNYLSRTLFTDFLFSNRYHMHTNNNTFNYYKYDLNSNVYEKSKNTSFYDKFQEIYYPDILKNYKKENEYTHFTLYENKKVLKKLYLIPQMDSLDIPSNQSIGNELHNQNILFQNFFNTKENMLSPVTLTPIGNTPNVLDNKTKKVTKEYVFSLPEDTLIYFNNNFINGNGSMPLSAFKLNIDITLDTVKIPYLKSNYMYKNVSYTPYYLEKGEHTLTYTFENTQDTLTFDLNKLNSPVVYTLDETILNQSISNYFNETNLDMLSNGSDYMTATIYRKGTNQALGSTIPYDKFWKASVNHKEIPILDSNGFLFIDLSEIPEGSIIEFNYKIPYFKTIFCITLVSWIYVLFFMEKQLKFKFKKDLI